MRLRLPALASALLLTFGSMAQNRVLTIDQNSVSLNATVQTDSVTPSGKSVYSVILELPSGGASFLKNFSNPKAGFSFTISSLDLDLRINEVRNYTGVSVQEISIGPLNATSKNTLVYRVRVLATGLTLMKDVNQKANPPARTTAQLASNFRVNIDGISTSRVAVVSHIQTGSDKAVQLTISFADYRSWLAWFEKNKGQRIKFTIDLLSPSMKEVNYTITFTDVLVESLSQYSYPASEQIQQFQVGLRPKSIGF